MKSYGVTIQMSPLPQYVYVVLYIYYVVLTFESVVEILWCYHSNDASFAVSSMLLNVMLFVFSIFTKMKFDSFPEF